MWTEEAKAQAIELYQKGNPTPENSSELVAEIAEKMDESVNGVRMILSKAGVYIKKEPTKASGSASKTTTGAAATGGGTRVSKEASHASLVAAIEATGQTADTEIVSKLTGKAAIYLTAVITAAASK